jgi:ABC-type transporter Mla subunit MlaD
MRGRGGSALGNPVLVGAVTVLVVIVAVFLAYNANAGLPFVPTTQLKTVVPDAYKLVEGNEVREGGFRIGVVEKIATRKLRDGTAGAELTLKLDKKAAPVPADSSIRIRPRSALGLKYVELQRGSAKDTLADGATITVDERALTTELEDFFATFDKRTRDNVQANLEGYGNAFALRGRDINLAFETLPRLFTDLPPVMRVLARPDTHLARFFSELGDAARVSAPLAKPIADGFRAAGQTFEALSRDPEALKATIEKSPDTLAVGERSFIAQRPFLRDLALVSADLRGAAHELRGAAPSLTSALRAGLSPLRQSPALNRRLATTLEALRSLSAAPGTDRALNALGETMATLNPQLRYLGPYVTVCNYWNYWWTFLADHLTDEESTGTIQRVQSKSVSPVGDQHSMAGFGAPKPAKGLHAQYYAAAVDDQGNADCENGQRGYPKHLASGVPADQEIAVDSETPGNQGPTYTGRPRVPEGQTFQRLPSGLRFRP